MDKIVQEPSNTKKTKAQQRAPYEPPRLERKQSLRKVTLFSGGAVAAVGLTTGG